MSRPASFTIADDDAVTRRSRRRRHAVAQPPSTGSVASMLGLRVDDDLARFADSEYLRKVLIRICNNPDGWQVDPEAEPLICYAAARYAKLAVKFGLPASDAMAACFDAMRLPAVRFGDDPWGVITIAVVTTFHATQFADEALVSLDTARRGGLSGHRVELFSEREQPVWERDPGFACYLPDNIGETQVLPKSDGQAGDAANTGDSEASGVDNPTVDGGAESEEPGLSIPQQAEQLAGLFAAHGWNKAVVVVAIDSIMRLLAEFDSRQQAYEALRRPARSRYWRLFTGLSARSWTGLLRILLGTPGAAGRQGGGVLLRIAVGETIAHLEDDKQLVAAILQASPDSRDL